MAKAKQTDPLSPAAWPGIKEYVDMVIGASLTEDLGPGDITTEAIVSKTQKAKAVLVSKQPMVACGLFVAEEVFGKVDKNIVFTPKVKEGQYIKKGTTIAVVSGSLAGILKAERLSLNLLQRMSGVATMTREFAKKLRTTGVKVLDTRKTTPCLRLLEKYAVKAGGGHNHRFGLFDGILIKDNHIKAAGSITEAVQKVRRKFPEGAFIEVETKSIEEVREAVASEADIIMLDNMTPARIKRAISIIDESALVEVSGGVRLDNIRSFALPGVDFISVGALTHSAPAADISLDVSSCETRGQKRR